VRSQAPESMPLLKCAAELCFAWTARRPSPHEEPAFKLR
jgi:hypothetical protein